MNNVLDTINTSAIDPVTLLIAIGAGIIPAYLWLRFWLKEDTRKEPSGLLFLVFVAGMIAVILVLPLQKALLDVTENPTLLMIGWVTIEEVMKFVAMAIIVSRSAYNDEPVDYPIYAMTAALGFAALENALFLIYPIGISDTTVSLLTGNLRFLGATLLHAMSTGAIGLMLGLSFFKDKGTKLLAGIFGLGLAVTLHSTFNFFIMNAHGSEYIKIFGLLWVVAIISMLMFEKLRRMSEPLYNKEITKPFLV